MSDDLRTRAIRLAAASPKESSVRRTMLDVLANDVTFSGNAVQADKEGFIRTLNKYTKGAGRVIHLRLEEYMTWVAVFDTEQAAVNVFDVYKKTPGCRLKFSGKPRGWAVEVIR